MLKNCNVCQKPTNKFCLECAQHLKVYYCSIHCQDLDWPNHELVCDKKKSFLSCPPGFLSVNNDSYDRIGNDSYDRIRSKGMIGSSMNNTEQNPFFSPLDLFEAGGFRERPLVFLKSHFFSARSESSLKLPEFCSRKVENIESPQAEELLNQLVAHITPGLIDLYRNGDMDRLKSKYAARFYDVQILPFIFCFKINCHQDLLEMLQGLIKGYYIDPLIPSKFGRAHKSDPDSSFLFGCPKTCNKDELYNYTQKRIHSIGKSMKDVICAIDFDYLSGSGNCRLTSIIYFSTALSTSTKTYIRCE